VVGSWPDKDITTKAAGILKTELTAAGVPHGLKVYPGTKHASFNDTLPRYNADAAAKQRVLAFFDEHVRASPTSQ
jgi:carboxymethylenebutenolidase